MTRRHMQLAFVLAGAALTVGCSGAEAEPDLGTQPLATYSDPDDAGDAAGISGRLVLEEGCVYLTSPEFSERWVPVFRAEAEPEWRDGTLIFDGEEYSGDETVGLGGSEWGGDDADLSIPDACDDSPRWAAWQVLPGDAL
ncbi:hypothetical protein IWX64_000225 [Arthrobacter sp. CAN_A212]|uniref:hypothetical protein n=1 Tax=unclassified Arthrobacter TaxID=235627 RepID=UPI0018C9249A|nr:hypothetical protein [Arthrobacter sp. CAN_C5]MBP2215596.1 hypothetical protein [Arthrobacter sp. CAN_C5]